MEQDARGYRIALISDELANPAGDPDLTGVLERAGWGLMLLPPSWYPDDVAAPLLEQVGEQVEEFARHGYDVICVGAHPGLEDALRAAGAPSPEAVLPASA